MNCPNCKDTRMMLTREYGGTKNARTITVYRVCQTCGHKELREKVDV